MLDTPETPDGETSQVASPAEPEPGTAGTGNPGAGGVGTGRKQPTWTYFLTPAAVVIGAMIIAGAVWYTNGDGGDSSRVAAKTMDTAAGGSFATAPASGATTAPTDVLAAFTGYARQLGLDQQKFVQCLGKSETATLINTHLQRGSQLGVNGTPTFFINNKKIVGAQPAAIFDEVIAAELKGSPATLDGYSDAIKQRAATNPPSFEIVQDKVDVSGAVIEGNPGAKVMVAEFSDFQCPFCKSWFDTNMKRIRAQLGNDVAFAFLHFPIVQIHPNAGNASLAAICAGEQGKFAQMHDLLFQRQNEWAKLSSN